MSIQFKPDKRTEERYDREAKQFKCYLTGEEPWWNKGDEQFADSASVPTFKALDKQMAEGGEP
jgi:hypothetical protein